MMPDMDDRKPDYWLTEIEEGRYEVVEDGISNLGAPAIRVPFLHTSKMVAASEGEPIPVYVGKKPAPELGTHIGYGVRSPDGTVWFNLSGEKPDNVDGKIVRIHAVDED